MEPPNALPAAPLTNASAIAIDRFDIIVPPGATTRLIRAADVTNATAVLAHITDSITAAAPSDAPADLVAFDTISGGMWPIISDMNLPKNLASFHVGGAVDVVQKRRSRDHKWYGVEYNGRLPAEMLANRDRWFRTNGGDEIASRSACGRLDANSIRSWLNQSRNASVSIRLFVSTISYSLQFVIAAAIMMLATGGNAIITIDRIDIASVHTLAVAACYFTNVEIVHSLGHIYAVCRGRKAINSAQKALLFEGTATVTCSHLTALSDAYMAMINWYTKRATFSLEEWQRTYNY